MTNTTASRIIRVTTALSLVLTPSLGVAKETAKPKVQLDASTPDSPRTIRPDTSTPKFTVTPGPKGYTPIPNHRALTPFADNSQAAIADRVRKGQWSSNPDRIQAQPDRFGNRQTDPRFTTERVAAPRSVFRQYKDHLQFEKDKILARGDQPIADLKKKILTKAAKAFYDSAKDPKVPVPAKVEGKVGAGRALVVPGTTYTHQPGSFEPLPPEGPKPPAVEPIPAQPKLEKVTDTKATIEMDPKYRREVLQRQRLIPSEWGVFLDWKEETSRRMGKRIHDVLIGQTEVSNLKRVEVGGSAAATAQRMSEFSTHALTFGLALGVSAAINLHYDYPNNPMAVQKYFESMTDPVGWMALSGFLMAMAPFTKMMNSARIQKIGFAAELPLFLGGLALGSVIQSGITKFAREDDVRKCLGFTDLKGYRSFMNPANKFTDTSFTRDDAACDRAAALFYSSDTYEDIFVSSVPTLAATAISGTAIYSMLSVIQKYLPPQRVLSMLGLTAGSSPLILALRGTYTVGVTWMFMAATSRPQDALGHVWDNWLLASAGKEGPRYGKTVERTHSDLFKTWEATKASGWRDADILTQAKSVCFDAQRVGQKYYDCAKASELDFAGVLANHAKVQAKWRAMQIAPALQAYKDWTAKLATYRATYSTARAFYKKAIEQIVYTRSTPPEKADPTKVFSLANMDVRTVSPLLWGPVRSLVARLDIFESEDGKFGGLSTPLMEENLIGMMACGPDATGRVQSGFWSDLAGTAGAYLTGNHAPRDVIEDPAGLAAVFNPPRIVRPLPGTNASACEPTSTMKSGFSLLEFAYNRLAAFQPPTVRKIKMNVNGKQYKGLESYILENVRPDIITPGGINQFDKWWEVYVDAQDEEFSKSIKKDYDTVIEGPFKKALNNPDYRWCVTGSAKEDSRLERYLSVIGGSGGTCSGDRSNRLAYGVMNNLRDQARLYLAMMLDLYVSNAQNLPVPAERKGKPHYTNSVTEVEQIALMPAKRVMLAYDKFVDSFVNGSDGSATEATQKDMNDRLAEFLKIVYAGGATGLTFDGKPLEFGVAAHDVKIKTTGKTATVSARPNLSVAYMGQLRDQLMNVILEWEDYARIAGMQ